MGYDGNIKIGICYENDLKKILLLLGYKFYKTDEANNFFYIHYALDSDLYTENISIIVTIQSMVDIKLRLSNFGNSYDVEKLNLTLDLISKKFNVDFETDIGFNCFFDCYEENIPDLNCGLDKVNNSLINVLSAAKTYFNYVKIENEDIFFYLENFIIPTPRIFVANMGLSYLITIIEYFFKECYIVLLKNKSNLEAITKEVRLNCDDIEKIKSGVIIERIIANKMSFQNLSKINDSFNKLGIKDVFGPLKKVENATSKYDRILYLLELRHKFIHELSFDYEYNLDIFKSDIEVIEESIKIIFNAKIKH
ncbi:MAG: hypothetical protein ACRC5M_00410 [Anaeroplasmataceae bacterium]